MILHSVSRLSQSWLTRLALSVFLTLLWFERWTIYNRLYMALDGSWSIGLQLARQQHIPFGSGVLFTYGPLSFGLSRLPIGLASWQILIFDLASMAIMTIAFWKLLNRRFQLLWGLIISFIILMTRSTFVNELGFYLFFVSLFLFLDYRSKRTTFSLVLSLLVGVIAFFLKANTGIVTLTSLFILGLDGFHTHHLTSHQRWLMVGLTTGFILAGAYLLHTDLIPYFIGSFHIVASFNDVMYLEAAPFEHNVLKLALGIVFIFAFNVILSGISIVYQKQGRLWLRQNIALLSAVALLLFAAFKYSFVRADSGHVGNFAEYSWMAFLLVYVYGFGSWLRYSMLAGLVASILIPFLMLPIKLYPHLIVDIPRQMQSYVQSVLTRSPPSLVGVPTPLPANWQRWLKGRTVDAMPWDVAALYANNLLYQPRPILQTYQVTDGYLDGLNAQHYRGPMAPEAIWFQHKTTDNRYTLSDEPQTKLAILEQYNVMAAQPGQAILNRRLHPNHLKPVSQWHRAMQIGTYAPLTVPDGSICLLHMKVEYKIPGYIRRLCHKPVPLLLDLKFQNGTVYSYRATIPLLENGMLVFGQQQPEGSLAEYFLRTEQNAGKLTAIRVRTGSSIYYKPTINMVAEEKQLIQM